MHLRGTKSRKLVHEYLTFDILQYRISQKYGKAKWIEFAEDLLHNGYKVSLYEAKTTFSKYLTIEKGNKKFKVRFSNHRPNINKELENDCDFFVGVTNFEVHTTKDALNAVRNYFK